MKKTITLSLTCLLGLSMAEAQTFSDSFESYTVGLKLGSQSPNWRTWGGAGGGTDDVLVVSTDNHTVSGTKSIYFSSTSATGGPQDCVLPFGTAPLSTGQFTYTSWFKVPTNKTAYFNFQGTATMGGMYTLDCWMNADGTLIIQNSGTTVLSSTFPVGVWFELSIDVNFNTNNWKLLVDGVSQGTWMNANNQVYAIDIFPADASAKYWVDDVSYNVVPYTLPSVNGATNLIGVTNGLVGQQRTVSVKVRNLGTTAITSFDLSIDQNGGTPFVQNITGANIVSLATSTLTITNPFTLLSGANTFRAIISNVNGLGADGASADDTIITTLTPVLPALGKMVVAEEGTGTWCSWCPRGAVYMDLMNSKYDGYFAGIAVHNGDPMIETPYDSAMALLVSGYPSALVDRGTEEDPSVIEGSFLQRIQIAPKAFIVNGAQYNATSRQLDVSITATFQQAVSGDYRIACIIVEDSVTGTAGSYSQANSYAGGSNGPMGGFESLPNPVPAAQMNYNHVARNISPSFDGLLNSYPASINVNDVFTHNFSFTLPAAWDANQIHIMSIMLDPTSRTDNASSATISEAVANGYSVGTIVTSIIETNAPDAQISLFPNPATDRVLVSLNLIKEASVQLAVYGVDGALAAKKDYGKLNGGMLLPIEMSNFNSGMYFVTITIDGKTTMRKFVKQ